MTILELLRDPTFPKKTILEKLVIKKLSITKTDLFKNSEKEIPEADLDRIKQSYESYTIDKKPLSYILGFVEFLGVSFHVTPDTLIPRPETEYMIEAVNERVQKNANSSINYLLDIGTGCGVLGCSVLYHNPGKINTAIFTDISEKAVDVARRNYTKLVEKDRNTAQDQFIVCSMLDHKTIRDIFNNSVGPILLVANLPYIPEELFDKNTDETVKKREPKFAFVGGDDGLDRYRVMLNQMISLKKTKSYQCVQFLEMMTRQVDILRNEYGEIFIFEEVKTFHFNIRIVKAKFRD